ncbi:MAG: D-alanyl-D-alanine carboxypeptidase/D-alanyl-D-alanine-endopeptidase [Polyangiaceae bacterium]
MSRALFTSHTTSRTTSRAALRAVSRPTPRASSPRLRRAVAFLGLVAVAAFASPGLGEPPAPAPSTVPSAPAAQAGSASPSAGASSSASPSAAPAVPASSLDTAKVRAAASELLKDAAKWGGTAGVAVIEIPTGAVVASANEHAALNPASNAKLATAAAALRLLGAEHRFLTGLYGKLQGDRVPALVLRGAGDPTLTSADLGQMARDLHLRGVRKVGAILVDQSAFDDVFTPPAFDQQPNEWAPFRAPVAAVAIDAATLEITVQPTAAGKPASVRVEPAGIAAVTGTVRTTKKGDPEKLGVAMSTSDGAVTVKVSGHVPEEGSPLHAWKRLEDPRLAPGLALRADLAALGVEVGEVRVGTEKDRALLAAHRSEPLAHILARLGKDSDNFVAETVFKAIAADRKRPATFEAAAALVSGELRAMGAFEKGCSVTNGSGLFDANRTTAASTAQLLRAMHEDTSAGPEYVAQLAIGGVDGTLRSRFRSWAKVRAIRAKTGTLNAVFALSGYVLPPPGKPALAFALFVNDAPGKAGAARASIDRVVDAAARAVWGAPPK